MFGNFFGRIISNAVCVFALVYPLASIFSIDRNPTGPIPPFALLTVPKSGSHMVMKALHEMTGAVPIWHTKFPSLYYIPGNEAFLYTHLCISPLLERDYSDLPKMKKIINVRDFRDVCVSIVHQIRRYYWPGMNANQREEFLKLSFDEQLHFVIDFDYDTEAVAAEAPNSLQVSMVKIVEQAIRLSKDPNNLVSKYENLVGVLGGGSDEEQILELERIADFLEIPVSQWTLSEIASNIYGDQKNPFGKEEGFENFKSTFKQGKIGSWKNVFNEGHKEAFKKKLGSALIAFGYEMDDRW